MKSLFLTLFQACLTVIIFAQENPRWMRYISISPSGQEIVFTYKGDLYKVATKGGKAIQLTFHQAHDYMPIWSKDGKQLAFASDRYGNFDIYVMSSQGGMAERITFHSSNEIPFSFSSDNQAIYFGAVRQDDVKHRQFPSGSQPELYSVPVKGGRVMQELTIPAEYVQVSQDGNTMIYHDKKGGENEWRKHHQSAICRDIWLFDKGQNSHTMLTNHSAEDRHPWFSEDENSIYYLSERSGNFNIHKRALTQADNDQQLTQFSLHPVRFLSYGGGLLAFGYDGEIYTMQEGQEPQKVSVEIVTQNITNTDKIISLNGGISEMEVAPNGKEIAFIARGEVFVTSVDDSYTKRLTNTAEQERFVTWTADGSGVVYASERNGKWSIYKTTKTREEEPFFFACTLVKEEPLFSLAGDAYLPRFSPDSNYVAYVKDRRNIVVRNLASGQEIVIQDETELYHMRDGDKYFRWSPDSKWLLISWGKSLSNSEVLLAAADGSKKINLNESGYYDYAPKWVNDGKQMIWFSNRDGLKSLAQSGRSESDVYSMFFTREAWEKFNMSKEDFQLMKEIDKAQKENDKKDKDEKAEKEKEEDKKKEVVVFELDNLEDRIKRLTIHSSRLGDAVLSKDGENLYYLARFEDKLNLWTTNLRTKETKMAMKVGANSGSLVWDQKQENLYLLSSGRISKINPKGWKKEAVKIKGEMPYDAELERQYMFDHVWIRTNAIFYHPGFHGIDWKLMKEEYQKYLPHIGNSYEFAEMLSEMLGELNVSHAGARYRKGIDNGDATASLGIFADYNHKGNGILVDAIIKGGPLDRSDIDLKPGMIIEKINGELISPNQDVAKYLNRLAGDFTLLEIYNPSDQVRKEFTIKPITLGEERRLLYKRWVEMNEEEVKKRSNGLLGYVHIPGMSDGPYRDIYSDMLGKYFGTKGIIVDSRFNGGGDLVGDLAMFFTGEPFITYATEAKVVGGEPNFRWTKPTLALIGEAQYSDGHCFACGYTDLQIGKTVGMPTPGTCSFAGWEGLPDGTFWGVVPISAKDKDGDWMENNQTEPNVKVKNLPGIIDQGRDQQLEKAVEVLLKVVGN